MNSRRLLIVHLTSDIDSLKKRLPRLTPLNSAWYFLEALRVHVLRATRNQHVRQATHLAEDFVARVVELPPRPEEMVVASWG